jgi:hypothetical protein
MMASYTERYVAFLDMIGFKDLIQRSVGETASVTVEQIREVLKIPEPAQEEQIVLGRIGDISKSGHRLVAFSDSVVISTEATDQGLMHLLHYVEKIGFRLVHLGTLYRGGIDRGLVYHDSGQVFGPAVIAAIEIEKLAQWPRVVLSDAVVKAGRSAPPPVDTIFQHFTRRDEDGKVFVHYLRILRAIAGAEGPTPVHVQALHAQVETFIQHELSRFQEKPNERRKIEWFQNYFRWATDKSWKDYLRTPYPGYPTE